MTDINVDERIACVRVGFADGTVAQYPFIWLRDNCPTGFHEQTQERTFDLLSVPLDIRPRDVTEQCGAVIVTWEGSDHISQFPLEWLKANQPGQRMPDPASVEAQIWRNDLTAASIPSENASVLLSSNSALLSWLTDLKRVGLGLVDGLEDDPEAGFDIARRVGFFRETNFGRTFEVMSKPDPNNLAYTSHELPLHTDLPNQEMPPGFQFLHCIANEASGGGSVFCDGYAVAEDMRTSHRDGFDLLSRVKIPLRFHDGDCDIRMHDSVIRCADDGSPEEVRFNAHIAGIFDIPAEQMMPYYEAYRAFMRATRAPDYRVSLKLKGGVMAVFDNRRVLHGREAFDPSTGFRHLRGCYVDRGEWDSRIRVLSRETNTPTLDVSK